MTWLLGSWVLFADHIGNNCLPSLSSTENIGDINRYVDMASVPISFPRHKHRKLKSIAENSIEWASVFSSIMDTAKMI